MIGFLIQKIKAEFQSNKRYILYIYIFTFYVLLPHMIVSVRLETNKRIVFVVILYFILIFLSKFNKYVYAISILYLTFANLIIFHTFLHWGYDGSIRIRVILESPASEILEYFSNFLDWRDFLLLLYTVTVIYFLYRLIKHYKTNFKIMKFLGLLIASGMIFLISLVRNPFTVEPLGIPYEYYKAKIYLLLPKERTVELAKEFTKPSMPYRGDYDKVVIVQGESASSHHMSLYGYSLKTTPFFDQLKSDPHFHRYFAIAPANQTRLSVVLINTPAKVGNFIDPYMKNFSLIGLFRRYGFTSYNISSQRSSGMTNATIGSLGNEANVSVYRDLEGKNITDMWILEYLHNIHNHSTKEFYFLHLIGSHFDYDKRYDKNIRLHKNTVNKLEEYDNTIYYTDYVLKKIFEYFIFDALKDKKILIVYISDHGEVVNEKDGGHGYTPPYKYEYDVPFVIYSNIDNPRIIELEKKVGDKKVNLESLYDIVTYITGLNDTLNISFSKKVNCLEPENIYDYKYLETKPQ